MKSALLIMALCIVACGRDNQRDCKSREHMRIQCQVEQVPAYGRPYAVELCNRTYEADRCY